MTTSVALCTYNGSQYLRQQLESISDQSYCVDEIVICDDNSRDDTCCIIEKFIRQHPEIKVVFIKNERNVGFLKNFEKAISCCSGDIIFLSDNMTLINKITKDALKTSKELNTQKIYNN